MNLSRRSFLTGAAALASALILPELVLPKRMFFLPPAGGWGWRSDDSKRLQSMIDEQTRRGAYRIRIPPGLYEITETIRLNRAADVLDASFFTLPEFDRDTPVFHLTEKAPDSVIWGCYFDTKGSVKPGATHGASAIVVVDGLEPMRYG